MAIDVKRLLSEAVLEICNEKPLAKLTVQDILEKTGACRQTFYNHFRDKNDLITWTYCNYVIGDFCSEDMSDGFYNFLCRAHEHCVKYKSFYAQAVALKGQNCLREHIFEQNFRNYLSLIIKRHGESVLTDELLWAIRFNSFGAINMHLLWVEEGMKLAPEVKAKYVFDCIPESIKQYLPI